MSPQLSATTVCVWEAGTCLRRRVFQEHLGLRYELSGIAEQEQLFAPPDLRVELILRTAVPFLRD